MFGSLLKKEIQDTFKTTKFIVAFAAYVILIPLALYTGEKHYEARLASHQQALSIYENSLKGSKGSLDVSPQVLYQPTSLMILSRDMTPYMPEGYIISADEGIKIKMGKFPPRLFEKMFGHFDLIFVISVLVSLLSVLVIYDAVSGEKDQGMLRLVFSYPVPRSYFLLAKYLGALLASGACLLTGFLAGLALLATLTNFPFSQEFFVVLLAVFVLTVLYCSAALLLGLVVSTFTHRPSNSLLVAITLWMLFVLVVPRLGMLAAENLAPVDSPRTLSLQEELIRKSIEDQQNRELRKIFGRADYAQLRQPVAQRYQQELTRALTKLETDYMRSRRRQEELALLLASLSPTAQFIIAVTEVTNTGHSTLLRLLNDVSLYYSTIESVIYSQGFRDQIPNAGVQMLFVPVELERIPRFVQTQPSLKERVDRSLTPALVLVLFNFVLFVSAYVKSINYDPR